MNKKLFCILLYATYLCTGCNSSGSLTPVVKEPQAANTAVVNDMYLCTSCNDYSKLMPNIAQTHNNSMDYKTTTSLKFHDKLQQSLQENEHIIEEERQTKNHRDEMHRVDQELSRIHQQAIIHNLQKRAAE